MRLAWLFVVAACYRGATQDSAPTCTAAAEHVRELLGGQRAIQVRNVFAQRCDADGWSDEVRACVVATTSLRNPRHCKAKLPADQRAALDRDLDAIDASERVPPACSDYKALIERLGSCRGVPLAARRVLVQAYADVAVQWTRGGTYDPRALDSLCRSMVEGLRQAIAPTCGW